MKLLPGVFALTLAASAANAAGVADYYGRWSNGQCDDDWFALADGKITTFNKQFANIARRPTEVPAKITLEAGRLSVAYQERGRTPRREVYQVDGSEILVLQDTFVDGRRMPSITRDQVTYRRCK